MQILYLNRSDRRSTQVRRRPGHRHKLKGLVRAKKTKSRQLVLQQTQTLNEPKITKTQTDRKPPFVEFNYLRTLLCDDNISKKTNSLIRVVTNFLAKCHLDKRFALDSVEYLTEKLSPLLKNSVFSNQLPTISFAERFENSWLP